MSVLHCKWVNLSRQFVERTSEISQKWRTGMLVIKLLPLSSKCNPHYLLYNNGAGPWKHFSLAVSLILNFASRGCWRDIAGGRGSLSWSRCVSTCFLLSIHVAVGSMRSGNTHFLWGNTYLLLKPPSLWYPVMAVLVNEYTSCAHKGKLSVPTQLSCSPPDIRPHDCPLENGFLCPNSPHRPTCQPLSSWTPESLPALPVCIPEVFPLASPADYSSLASPPPPRRVVSACLMSMLKAIPWAAATPLGFGLGFHRFESQPENRDHAKFASSSGTFLRPRVLCSVLFTSHSYYSVTVSNSWS